MNVLEVKDLCKRYEGFTLDHVGFMLERGKIMGFIGRNGAGKTTTLKSLLNFVHPDSGTISFFGKSFAQDEFEIKQRIGFVSGGVDYYAKKKLRTITAVTRRFYERWDDAEYRRYLELFRLDERKTPDQLSAGMRVKYALTLALSHHAELLLLDEPTSGLDPVSRDDLLEVFLTLADSGVSILFSTHITSDLDKCADDITYIKGGRVLACTSMQSFVSGYRVVELPGARPPEGALAAKLIGCKRSKTGHTALLTAEDAQTAGVPHAAADLEAIMVHLEKEESR